jgi:large subunit ribosomal protein L41
VSYRAPDVYQTEFTPKDLFDAVYKPKIEADFTSKNLDADGLPKEPSPEEKLTPEEAFIAARKVGNDLFSERIPKRWECLEQSLIEKKPRECE